MPSKIDLTNTNQKFFAGLLLVGVLFGLYYLLPPLVYIFANLYLLVGLLIPVAYVAMNPYAVWSLFKQLSWSLTKFAISKDKPGTLIRYHEYLTGLVTEIDESVKSVAAVKKQFERTIISTKDRLEDNKKKAIEYQNRSVSPYLLKTVQNQVAIDDKKLQSYLPKVVLAEQQEKSLVNLRNELSSDAEVIKYKIDSIIEDYRLFKEMSKASDKASKYFNKDTEQYKMYQEGLRQTEIEVSQYMANVEDFQRKALPLFEAGEIERTISEEKGLQLIEEFKKSRVLLTSEKEAKTV